MKCICRALLLVLISIESVHANPLVPVSRYWRQCAAAKLIFVGRLDVPINRLRADLTRKDMIYREIPVSITHVLKGTRRPMRIRYSVSEVADSVSLLTLSRLNKIPVVVFLSGGDDQDLYLEGRGSVVPANPSTISELQDEIIRQQKIDEYWSPHPQSPHYRSIEALLSKLTRSETQGMAVSALDLQTSESTIALIDLMDDRRPLAYPWITLRNRSPKAFEATRHYGPRLVVDVAAAILEEMTGQDFFSEIHDGGSEEERRDAVIAWRVYGDMLLNHSAQLNYERSRQLDQK